MAPPVSARNNNPLNIRPGQPYEGLADPAQQDGFCNFSTPVWGFRAVFRNYITKFDRGVNTIRKLIGEWAPPGDNNNTASYIGSVCASADFGPDEVINLKSWDVASKVCYAQAVVESGQPFETNWKMADMAEGALRAGITDAPGISVRKIGSAVASSGSAISGVVAAVQPSVEAAVNAPHSPNVRATLVVLAIALAALGAFLSARKK